MAFGFNKGTWDDRVSDNITRRALTVVSATGTSGIASGDIITADIARADSNVSVVGTPFNHTNMYGLETRIDDAFTSVETKVNLARNGVTLYDNQSGSGGTITLSGNIQNYDYAKITYVNNSSWTFRTTTILPKYNKNWELWFVRFSDSDGYAVFDFKNIYADGTSISNHHIGYGNFNNDNYTNIHYAENNTKITKVIGYKNNI